MHHHNEVSVFIPALSGQQESPAGVGWLVTPSVVVMRLPGRGATSGQPSHVTVPAASGGGRAGSDIPVLGAYDSPDLAGWWALALDMEADSSLVGDPPQELDLSAFRSDDTGARAGDGADYGPNSWICRCFPRLPACR